MTKQRILVVDDDPGICQTLRIALGKAGRSKNLNPLSYSEVLGAVRAIAKPFTLEEMLAMVKQELRQ